MGSPPLCRDPTGRESVGTDHVTKEVDRCAARRSASLPVTRRAVFRSLASAHSPDVVSEPGCEPLIPLACDLVACDLRGLTTIVRERNLRRLVCRPGSRERAYGVQSGVKSSATQHNSGLLKRL